MTFFLAALSADSSGLIGSLVAFSFMASSTFAALLVFFMLWRKKHLNFDEEAAITMLNEIEPDDDDDRKS